MRATWILLLLPLSCASLTACSSRNWYEGIRQGERARQQQAPGEPASSAPDVDYDAYQAERERLSKEAPQ
ncbi:MAG: hypothetical protein KDH15_21375 [Rhodocyclaceae bacterium]|nr:hypothetical protein [Rhodocyclaceae bacterium]